MVSFYSQEYYQKHKEEIKERNRKYYELNREERLQYQHAYNWMTETERKQKNKQRYWEVRDKNKPAKPKPDEYPVEYRPVCFSPSFN